MLRRRMLLHGLIVLVALLMAGCGGNADQPGGLEGQVMAMVSGTEQPRLLPGAIVAISGPNGSQTAVTDAEGRYQFATLAPGAYGMATSFQGLVNGATRLQPEERRFTISAGQDETISLVLLAEGIEPPPAPPAPAVPVGGQPTASGFGGGGFTSSPFFWYWLFSRPHDYGYYRPPVVINPSGGGPVVVQDTQPDRSPSGRPYTRYGDADVAGVRAKPVPEVVSRGSTRPGASGAGSGGGPVVAPPRPSSPASSPPKATGSGSQGTTRPGGATTSRPSSQPPVVKPPSSSGGSRSSGGGRRR